MGPTLHEQGKLDEAIEAYNKALAIKPDFAEVYCNMGNALNGITFEQPNPSLQKTIFSLLDKKSYARPKNIAPAAISLLKFEPELLQHLKSPPFAEAEPKILEVIADLSTLPLLPKLMSVCPLADIALEHLFSVSHNDTYTFVSCKVTNKVSDYCSHIIIILLFSQLNVSKASVT